MNQIRRAVSHCNLLRSRACVMKQFPRNLADKTDDSGIPEKKNEMIRLDPMELATGMYKTDILDRLGGDDDPYSVKTLSRIESTKEKPNMIPSAFESRMVGCVCEEDSNTIVWMWLQKGEPKRCQCGHWFQLYYQPMLVEEKSSIPV